MNIELSNVNKMYDQELIARIYSDDSESKVWLFCGVAVSHTDIIGNYFDNSQERW